MPKVVHLTSVHNPFDSRIFYKECKTLADAGYDVVLIAPHSQNESVGGVRIRAVPEPVNRFRRLTVTSRRIYRAALEEKADLYHFHDPELIAVGLLIKTKLKKPVIYDVHEDYFTSIKQKRYLPSFLRIPAAYLMAGLEQAFTRPFKIILAEKYYARRFTDGVQVLNYPITTKWPAPALTVSPITKASPPVRLLYTGGINVERGALIHAGLVNYRDDIEVFMAGRCSRAMAGMMRQAAGPGGERLHIEGEGYFVPFKRIMEYYTGGPWTAGLAVFPPTPHYLEKELTKIFEYMLAGIPVLCSDFPAWRKLVRDTGAGLCVNPLDRQSIAGALEYLIQNPGQAAQMGENGRKAVSTGYNWNVEKSKLLGLYRDILTVRT